MLLPRRIRCRGERKNVAEDGMVQRTHQQVKSPCLLKGGRAPFHMVDARCEVSIECSDVGFGDVCLALVIDGVDCVCTFCVRLLSREMYTSAMCDRCATIIHARCCSQGHK
jgi:hypothetical protein